MVVVVLVGVVVGGMVGVVLGGTVAGATVVVAPGTLGEGGVAGGRLPWPVDGGGDGLGIDGAWPPTPGSAPVAGVAARSLAPLVGGKPSRAGTS